MTALRSPDDWYVEPQAATETVARVEGFTGSIHDPACGQGHIPRGLASLGFLATGTDIHDRAPGAPWFLGLSDFLDPAGAGLCGARNMMSNPPYFRGAGLEAFIHRGLALASGKVVVFCEARFLFGVRRAKRFHRVVPPDRIWLITPRPSCPPGEFLAAGGKAKGGKQDCVWMVWDERQGQARTGWLTK